MSTVWETRYRLFMEQLEQLAEWLSTRQAREPKAVEEQTVRLLMGVVRLLWEHRVNHRGKCRFCGWTRWGWRIWRPRPLCTVFRIFDFAMTQSVEMAWWQLLKDTGREVCLDEVREWMKRREQASLNLPVEVGRGDRAKTAAAREATLQQLGQGDE